MPNTIVRLIALSAAQPLRARIDVICGLGIEITGIGMTVAGPYALKLLIDQLSSGRTSPGLLVGEMALFILTWSGAGLTGVWRLVYTGRLVEKLARQLIDDAVRSQAWDLARNRSGEAGRIAGLLERLPFSLQVVIEGLFWRAAPLALQCTLSLILIGVILPTRYVLILALVLLGYLVACQFGARRYHDLTAQANFAASEVSRALSDVLHNAARVIFNGAIEVEARSLAVRSELRLAAAERLSWVLVGMLALQYGVICLGLGALLIVAGLDVQGHRLTLGAFVLLQAYAFRLTLPLSGFGLTLQQAGVSLANIGEVLDLCGADDVLTARQACRSPASAALGLRLDGVGYVYGPGQPGVTNIHAEIAAGSLVAIVGANGSGKSTLARLMAGLLDPSAGTVWLGDRDLKTVPAAERHRHVLYVPQFISLFHRSLRDNGLYPPTELTPAELSDLLISWRFNEDGRAVDIDARVGQHGERLSGGQVQKLELARLCGIATPVLILDESTSSLDPRSERQCLLAIRDRRMNAALVLVTHRLDIAQAADQVLFVRSGGLTAAGSHNDLLTQRDDYRALWFD